MPVSMPSGLSGHMLYEVTGIEDAATQIHAVAASTDSNYQQSVALVNRNIENFGGSASDAFQQVMQNLNRNYQNSAQTLQQAKVALEQALENILQCDQQRAAAYLGW
jgi:uncharacterized protein YukE